jgi:uncharacterized membrane protein (DUF106 family)
VSGEYVIYIIIALIALSFVQYIRNKNDRKQLDRISGMDLENKKFELMKMQSKMSNYKTNHILHLLLSIITFGIWIFAWILIAQSNSSKRKRIEDLIEKM